MSVQLCNTAWWLLMMSVWTVMSVQLCNTAWWLLMMSVWTVMSVQLCNTAWWLLMKSVNSSYNYVHICMLRNWNLSLYEMTALCSSCFYLFHFCNFLHPAIQLSPYCSSLFVCRIQLQQEKHCCQHQVTDITLLSASSDRHNIAVSIKEQTQHCCQHQVRHNIAVSIKWDITLLSASKDKHNIAVSIKWDITLLSASSDRHNIAVSIKWLT